MALTRLRGAEFNGPNGSGDFLPLLDDVDLVAGMRRDYVSIDYCSTSTSPLPLTIWDGIFFCVWFTPVRVVC